MTEILTLRIVACVGFVILACQHSYLVPGARPSTELMFASIAIAGGVLVLANFARSGLRKLWEAPDLLVPFGCGLAGFALIDLLPGEAMSLSFVNPVWDFELAGFGLLLLSLCLYLIVIFWTTELVLSAATNHPVHLLDALRLVWKRILRGAAVIAFAGLLLLGPIVLLASVDISLLGNHLTIVFLGIASLAINALTILWVPFALRKEAPLLEVVCEATGVAGERISSWAGLLFIWSASMGTVTATFSELSSAHEQQSFEGFHAHLDWCGGFPCTGHWYLDLCATAEVLPEGLLALPTQLLLVVVAIAAKITIMERLFSESAEPTRRMARRRRRPSSPVEDEGRSVSTNPGPSGFAGGDERTT